MPTRIDSRQVKYNGALSQLALTTADTELDDILASIDSQLTPPLRVLPQSPASRTITVGALALANPETGRNLSIPPINSLIPSFAGATVSFPAASGGSITGSPLSASYSLTVATGQYIKVGLSLDSSGQITLTFGTASTNGLQTGAGAPPTVANTYAIGYVVLRNISGTIQNVTNADIYQYVGSGGGSGGGGTGNPILESIKNQLADSPYQYATPYVVSTDGAAKISSLSGATYDLVTNTIKFTANSQVATSVQQLDPMFLADALDVGSLDFAVWWSKGTLVQTLSIPTSFTYEVSRDGGNNWFPVTMSQIGTTEVFLGSIEFGRTATTEATASYSLYNGGASFLGPTLNTTNRQAISQKFTLTTDTVVLHHLNLSVTKTGAPTGSLYVSIAADAAGSPGAILAQSAPVSIASLVGAPSSNTISVPNIVLTPGTYHIVLTTGADYKSVYSAGVTELAVRYDTSASAPFLAVSDGAAWSTHAPNGILLAPLFGRLLDLRFRVTSAGSPAYPVGLDAWAIFYGYQSGTVGGVRKTQRFTFSGSADVQSFTITAFNPDPDLLTMYVSPVGQMLRSPDFTLNGNVVTVPAGTFLDASTTYTVIFDQNGGASYDNSDSNARLLAANFLGSTNGADDRSSPGRGFLLRRPDGTFRELTIDDSDNIVIYSV